MTKPINETREGNDHAHRLPYALARTIPNGGFALRLAPGCLVLALSACDGRDTSGYDAELAVATSAIIGGTTVPVSTQRALGLVNATGCSGQIMSRDWVLTANHCLQPETWQNFAEAPRADGSLEKRRARRVVQLRQSYPRSQDISLLQLEPTTLTTWPSVTRTAYTGTEAGLQGATLTGFGEGASGYVWGGGGGLIVSGWHQLSRTADTYDSGTGTYTMYAADGSNTAAPGDSGGPWIYQGTVAAITSNGSWDCVDHSSSAACAQTITKILTAGLSALGNESDSINRITSDPPCGYAISKGFRMKVYSFRPGELFVTAGSHLFKFSDPAGSGHHLFQTGVDRDALCTAVGSTYYKGDQEFLNPITDLDYDYVTGQMLVSLGDGTYGANPFRPPPGVVLKLSTTGGTGQNMFGLQLALNSNGYVNQTCGLKGTPTVTYLLGVQTFSRPVTSTTYIDGHTFVTLDDGRMLKVAGLGGGGCSMFAVSEDPTCGFQGSPDYHYYEGSQKFSSPVANVTAVGGQTFVGLANGTLLKVNGTGGGGCNMFAVQDSTNSLCGLVGSGSYPYYAGSQVLPAAVVSINAVDSKTLIALANGDLLKIDGTGGLGCNMFSLQADATCHYKAQAGTSYLLGNQVFPSPIRTVAVVAGQTFVSLNSGHLLKIQGAGGGGCNMFALQADAACGYASAPNYNYFAGVQHFTYPISTITSVGSKTYFGEIGGKLLAINGTGGGGCSMFAISESATDFTSSPAYNYYFGDQN